MTSNQRIKRRFPVIPILTLALVMCFNLGGTEKDVSPPKVRFSYLKGVYSKSRDDLKSLLSNSHIDKMKTEISNLELPLVNGYIFDALKDGTPRKVQMENNNLRSAVIMELRHDTLRYIKGQTPNNTCGAIVIGTKVRFLHCPGNIILLTLDFIERLSCRAIEKMDLFGPIILKNENCHQQLLITTDCLTAYKMGYLTSNCSITVVSKAHLAETVSFTIVSLVLFLLSMSLIIFLFRLRMLKKSHTLLAKDNTIEMSTFLTLGDSGNDWVNVKDDPEKPNTKQLVYKLPIYKMLLSMFCFFPLKVESYDLINSQIVAGEKFKYDLLMGDDERIPIGTTFIGMSEHSAISRLSYEFETYPWTLEIKNDYGCLQSKCNDITICREDLLPFQPANSEVKDFLNISNSRTVYSTCKNMWNYCTFASGCFIIGAVLNYDSKNPYKVYKVGKQHLSEDNLILPPGCYLDYLKIDESSNFEGLYYVENMNRESWFCKSSLYSHHPLPHSLGDLKVDNQGNVNFIADHIKCATDRWRDIYCYLPDSFAQEIDSYCVRNTEKNLGYKVNQHDSILEWEGRDLVNVKITCDRNLNLVHSKDHCFRTSIDVWDTQNEKDDLLITIVSHSNSNNGLYSFPKSIHMEIHTFPCNSQPYSSILYDLKSLNSSGIKYNYHINKKNLVPDHPNGGSTAPEGRHGGVGFDLSSVWSYITKIFSGFSGIAIIAMIIIVVILLKR